MNCANEMVLEIFIVSACIVDGGDLEITRAGISNGFFFCGAATQRGSWPPHS